MGIVACGPTSEVQAHVDRRCSLSVRENSEVVNKGGQLAGSGVLKAESDSRPGCEPVWPSGKAL